MKDTGRPIPLSASPSLPQEPYHLLLSTGRPGCAKLQRAVSLPIYRQDPLCQFHQYSQLPLVRPVGCPSSSPQTISVTPLLLTTYPGIHPSISLPLKPPPLCFPFILPKPPSPSLPYHPRPLVTTQNHFPPKRGSIPPSLSPKTSQFDSFVSTNLVRSIFRLLSIRTLYGQLPGVSVASNSRNPLVCSKGFPLSPSVCNLHPQCLCLRAAAPFLETPRRTDPA